MKPDCPALSPTKPKLSGDRLESANLVLSCIDYLGTRRLGALVRELPELSECQIRRALADLREWERR